MANAADLDSGFNPDANDRVHSIAVQADGKVLIGGRFTEVGAKHVIISRA